MHRHLSAISRHIAQIPPGLINAFVPLLVLGAIVILYLPALENGFVWDDGVNVQRPEYLLPQRWLHELTSPLSFFAGYYRPLPVASFITEIYLHGGPDARAMHLTNVLLHAINAVLVSILAFRLGVRFKAVPSRTRLVAVAAGLFYGTHPAMVEAATWISCRFDLLLTFFLLLALLANTIVKHRIVRPLLVGLFFLLAALSKESAAPFIFVLVAWNLAWQPVPLRPWRNLLTDMWQRGDIGVYMAVVSAGVLYLFLRHAVLGNLFGSTLPTLVDSAHAPLQHALLIAETLGRYLYTMVNPYSSIGIVHPHVSPVPLDDLAAWASVAVITAGLVLLVISMRRQPASGWLWIAMLASLLPILNFIPLPTGNNITHDRFLAYPLTLFVLALAASSHLVFRRAGTIPETQRALRRGAIALVAILVVFSAFTVRTTIPMWHNDTTLWGWAVARAPDSYMAQSNLSIAYRVSRDFGRSIKHGLNAIRIAPEQLVGYYTTGFALLDSGKPAEALPYLQRAAELSNSASLNEAYVNVALAHNLMQLGRYEEAGSILLKVTAETMSDAVNQMLYIVFSRTGRIADREEVFERLTATYPQEKKAEERSRLNQLLATTTYPKYAPAVRTGRRIIPDPANPL